MTGPMKLDPDLIVKITAAARARGKDPDELLRSMFDDICPECGQRRPAPSAPPVAGNGEPETPRFRGGRQLSSTSKAIIEFLKRDTEPGAQARAAIAFDRTRQDISQVWSRHRFRQARAEKAKLR
jgi:hypothetical protein